MLHITGDNSLGDATTLPVLEIKTFRNVLEIKTANLPVN